MMSEAEDLLSQPLTTTAGQPMRVAVYSRIADGIRTGTFPNRFRSAP